MELKEKIKEQQLRLKNPVKFHFLDRKRKLNQKRKMLSREKKKIRLHKEKFDPNNFTSLERLRHG